MTARVCAVGKVMVTADRSSAPLARRRRSERFDREVHRKTSWLERWLVSPGSRGFRFRDYPVPRRNSCTSSRPKEVAALTSVGGPAAAVRGISCSGSAAVAGRASRAFGATIFEALQRGIRPGRLRLPPAEFFRSPCLLVSRFVRASRGHFIQRRSLAGASG